jgi:two-component system, LytTR family, sensor kinase
MQDALRRRQVRGKVISLGSISTLIAPLWNDLPAFWKAQTIGWGAFTLFDLVNLQLTYHDFPIAVGLALLVTLCLVLISAVMREIFVWRGFADGPTLRIVVASTLLSLASASLIVAMLFSLHQLFGWTVPGWNPVVEAVDLLAYYFLALAAWSLSYFWIHAAVGMQGERQRATLAEADALRAELAELRLQLDPHFLLNTLNGVAEEIPEHPSSALGMLRDLAAYLQHSLAGIHQTVVSVEVEVEALSAYLRVQEARFGPRLRTKIHVDQDAASRQIVSFLLQPLVENAIKYGRREDGLYVSIDIRSANEGLRIEVENSGTLDVGRRLRRSRPPLGLENLRRRLALHYPDRHQFTLLQRNLEASGEPLKSSVIAALLLEGKPCSR